MTRFQASETQEGDSVGEGAGGSEGQSDIEPPGHEATAFRTLRLSQKRPSHLMQRFPKFHLC